MHFPLPVRPAEDGDWLAVWPLLQAMGQVDAEAGTRWRFKEIVRDNRQFLPVPLIDDRIAGYAWAHHGPLHLRAGRSTVRLNDLFVAPEWRRRGVGGCLLGAVQQWAMAQQATWLEWQASNAALPFYERLGFTGDPCPDPEHPFFEITLAADGQDQLGLR
jgi:GNAT superfamily N-acetyltransferase